MSVIYLQHERHGNKVACSEAEAQYDESKGWVRYNPSAPASEDEAVPEFLNNLTAVKRRGRPPKSPVEVPQETE